MSWGTELWVSEHGERHSWGGGEQQGEGGISLHMWEGKGEDAPSAGSKPPQAREVQCFARII